MIGLEKVFRSDLQYKRAGVVLSELTSVESISLRLYEQVNFERWHKLCKSIDEVNLRYGRDIIRFAALHDSGEWQSQSTFRSNDENHSVDRERLGLGATFSKSVRFL